MLSSYIIKIFTTLPRKVKNLSQHMTWPKIIYSIKGQKTQIWIHTKSIFNEEKINLRFRLGGILKFGLQAVLCFYFVYEGINTCYLESLS